MTQNDQVLKHLKTGSHITPLEAIGLYGVYRLAARIYELRNAGYRINTDVTFDKRGRQYARYSLAS